MTETVAEFISRLETKILEDVKPSPARPVAIMVIPGSFNPIHKGHLAMFDKAYKELILKNKDTLIYGVYVVADDKWVKDKITKAADPEITAIKNTDRIKLCSEAFSDYYESKTNYTDKLFVYPVEYGDGHTVLDRITDKIKDYIIDNASTYDVKLITGYLVCGSDHIYDEKTPDKGSYLWGHNVIAIVRKDDVEKIKTAQITTTEIGYIPYTLSERWTKNGNSTTKIKGTISFIQPEDGDLDAGMSSSLVRGYLKEGATACEKSKIGLRELLTTKVYDWIMKNIMTILTPDCNAAQIEAVAEIKTETTPIPIAEAPVSEAAPVPRVETESVAESLSEAAPVSEAESVAPVLVSSNYFISIHFKTDDQWTFYRCLMRGYLISTYIAAHEAPDADPDAHDDADADATDKDLLKGQIRRAMYNSAKSVLHADNVFHFDDVSIAEYDAIIGMITRMSRWFKFKLDQSVPRKAISSVEDGGALMSNADYFVHQLDAAFKVVDTGSEQSTMSINEFMDDLTADIDNANSSKVLAAWDATGRAIRTAAAATRRAPGAAWTATKSAANSVADAVSKRASQANTTRKNVSASVDKSVAESAESFAARRRAVADASAAAAAAKAGSTGGSRRHERQMKQTGGAYKNAEAFAGMMTKLKQYVGDDGAPANKPAMLADEYFERLSKVVAGVSRPSIFGHPLLLYLPFARAFNCVIYVYKPSQSDTDNYILKYIFRGAEAEEEESKEEVVEGEEEEVAHAKEVHEIHILDKNPDDSAFLDDDVESYSSRFALLVLSGTPGTVGSDSIATGASTTTTTTSATNAPLIKHAVASDTPVKVKNSHPADASIPILPKLPVPVSTAICDENKELTEECQNDIFKLDTTGTLSTYLSAIGTKYKSTKTATNARNVVPSGSATIIKLGNYGEIEYKLPAIAANVKFILQAATGTADTKNTTDLATYGSDALTNTVFNCLYLANKNGVDGIIFPMIGGSIFVDRIYITDPTSKSRRKITPDEIVERLMMGATQFIEKYHSSSIKTIGFCAFNDDAAMMLKFVEKYNAVVPKTLQSKIQYIPMKTKDDYFKDATTALTNNSINAALVNAANTELEFGGGISAAFSKNLNDMKIGISKIIDDEGKNFKNLFHDAYSKYLKVVPTIPANHVQAKPIPAKPIPAPIKSGGTKLKIMTFNTCHEALGAKASGTLDMTHCKIGSGANTCRDNIFKVVKKSIADNYDFILLQEMTSDFEDIMTSPINDITTQLTQPPLIPNLKYYSDDKYYGYHYTCKESCIGILHLQSMGHATKYFAGNLAGIPYTAEPKNSVNAGARPFIMLLFETKKLIVVNVHAPKGSFKKWVSGVSGLIDYTDDVDFENAITSKPPTINDIGKIVKFRLSSPNYAFQYVIQDAIRTQLGIADTNLPEYKIIIAGDFNTPNPAIQIGSDEPKKIAFTTPPKGNVLNGNTHITCAFPISKKLTNYKTGELSDHILSNMKMETGSYKIFDGKIDGADIPGILKTPPEFSDHLPVYATITSEKEV